MMELSKQVVSLELSKGLKELEVKQESYFKWVGDQLWDETQQSDYESPSTSPRSTWIAAFTGFTPSFGDVWRGLVSPVLLYQGDTHC
jgi:hypothetical protein